MWENNKGEKKRTKWNQQEKLSLQIRHVCEHQHDSNDMRWSMMTNLFKNMIKYFITNYDQCTKQTIKRNRSLAEVS